MVSAATTGAQWGETYTYDGFGNLTAKTPTKGSAPSAVFDYGERHLRIGVGRENFPEGLLRLSTFLTSRRT